jgi:hypothetical protein
MADTNSKLGDTRVDIARSVSQLLDHSWLALTAHHGQTVKYSTEQANLQGVEEKELIPPFYQDLPVFKAALLFFLEHRNTEFFAFFLRCKMP